jgi:hypothetical protein
VKRPGLQFVRVDGGGHGPVFESECGVGMLEAFLADPQARVDTSCTPQVKASALAFDAGFSRFFFGTESAWD